MPKPRHVLIAALAAVVATATGALAQEKFPSRTIEVITHAGAGGGTDIMAQMMMKEARDILKTDLALVNKRGGGGAVGARGPSGGVAAFAGPGRQHGRSGDACCAG